jgi:hypothetical protein
MQRASGRYSTTWFGGVGDRPCNVRHPVKLRLYSVNSGYIDSQFWGGVPGKNGRSKYYKIVMSPCSGGNVVSFYCKDVYQLCRESVSCALLGFMPTELTKHHEEGFTFKQVPVEDMLQGLYSQLDPDCLALLRNSVERMPWRLYVHQPYEVTALLEVRLPQFTNFHCFRPGSRGMRVFSGMPPIQ